MADVDVKLNWRQSELVWGLYALAAVARGLRLADGALEAELIPLAVRLTGMLAGDVPVPDRFFDHAPPLAAEFPGTREIARIALTRLVHSGRAERLTPPYGDLLAAVADVAGRRQADHPTTVGEHLPALQASWKIDGAGLLADVARWTDAAIVPDSATVMALPPVLGAGGAAYPAYNRVCIEVVGSGPLPELPEVARLAWLIGQLNLDLPHFAERLTPRRVRLVQKLSMLTAAVANWFDRDTGCVSEAGLAQALAAWVPELPEAPALPPALVQWWDVYRERRPPWPVALQALDQYLAKVLPDGSSS